MVMKGGLALASQVLLQFGGADPATMDGARDADGFTALMQVAAPDRCPSTLGLFCFGGGGGG